MRGSGSAPASARIAPGSRFSTNRWFDSIIIGAAVLLFCLAFGYAASHFSFTSLGLLPAAAILFWLVAKRPQWSLVLLLGITSTLITPEFFTYWMNPDIIYLADVVLLLLVITRSLFIEEGTSAFERLFRSPTAIALSIFGAIVMAKVMAILVAGKFSFNSLSSIDLFIRPLSFYMLFVPVVLLLRTEKQQKWMVGVMFALAIIVVTGIILQIMFPDNYLVALMNISQSLRSDTPSVDPLVQRLRPAGGVLVLACFWIGLMNIVLRSWSRRRLALFAPLTLLMLLGVTLEFNRSYMVPIAALLLVTLLINRRNVRLKLIASVAIVGALLVLFSAATGTMETYVSAVTERYGSTFSNDTLESQSLGDRQVEDDYAWSAIGQSPIFGISLEQFYRPSVPGMFDNLRWYIHNAYLWFWTYFGVLGLAAFLAVLAAMLLRGIFNWTKISDPLLQSALLGLIFTVITLAVADFVAPKFYDFVSVPILALIFGLSEAIISREHEKKPVESEAGRISGNTLESVYS